MNQMTPYMYFCTIGDGFMEDNKNKPNYIFLKQMKQRLIKTLVYNKIIYKRKNGAYEEYKYYGLLE